MSQQKKTEILRNFPDVIKGIRLRKGLSQEAFAELIGVSPGAVGNWESRANAITNENLSKVADKLCVSVGYLLGEVGEAYPKSKSEKPSVLKEHGGPYWGSTNSAPIVSWASAGQGHSFQDQGQDVEHVATDCKDPNCYALEVDGDSMETKYSKGDILVLSPRLEAINGGLVVAKSRDEENFFKIYHRSHQSSGKDLVRLSSYNPAYPLLEFPIEELRFIHPVHSVIRRLRKD